MKTVLQACLKYSKERKAFGKLIGDFGMIQHKLAEMAVRTFAAETVSYRVAGLVQGQLGGFSWSQPDAAQRMMRAAEEFAAECSYVKVFASEVYDYVVDEGVQIHGGYGYHQDYAVERAYRDARINRIFEGTNEINRMLATGMLLKRAQRGRLGLVEAVKALEAEILSGPPASGLTPARGAKKAALFCLGAAYQRHGPKLEDQQEVLAGITDVAMTAFALESVVARAAKSGSGLMADYAAVFAQEAMETVESAGKAVLAACSEGDALRINLGLLRRYTKMDAVDVIGTRRRIAGRLLEAGRYVAL
jgi:hypothetical protein